MKVRHLSSMAFNVLFRCICLVALLFASPAWSQQRTVVETAKEKASREADLAKVNADLAAAKALQAKLDVEIEALDADLGAITRASVEATARAQDLEGDVAETETRLEDLAADEKAILVPLSQRRVAMMEVLGALQRVGQNPPPALLVSPDDALSSVHSSLLLGAVVPQLRDQAAALRAELKALARTRQAIGTQKVQLAKQLAALSEDEARLARLEEEKRALAATSQEQLAESEAKAERLAREASTLTALIDDMESNIADAARAAEAARLADARRSEEEADRLQQAREALASGTPNEVAGMLSPTLDPARKEPAIAFARARGLLPRPVKGVELYGFGTSLPTGPRGSLRKAPNVATTTRAGAIVRAPADGWVVYAGPFRSYGAILILNAGDSYHVVLSGMAQVDVTTGRFVLAGEPVGRMGARRTARASVIGQGVASLGGDRPVLYVEFRKDGTPIDPQPWWVREETVDLASAKDAETQ